MSPTRFSVQATFVVVVVAFVSWPEFRPVHAQTGVWKIAPAASRSARATDTISSSSDGRRVAAYTINGQQSDAARRGSDVDAAQPFVTPGVVIALGGKLNALVGLARTSLNTPIPYARVVARNMRTGRIQGWAFADQRGRFSFLDLDVNAYVVELLGPDGSVAAVSEMVVMARGDVRQTIVRAPASAASVRASFGNSLAPTMLQATVAAADDDVTRTSPTLLAQESSR